MPDPIPTNTAPQTALSVPEIPSAASAPNVTVVDVPVSPVVKETAKSLPGIQSPKEALGEDPQAEMDAMEERMGGKLAGRPRDEKGRLIPTNKSKETIQPQPDKPKVKPAVQNKTDLKTPKAPAAPKLSPVAEQAKPEEVKPEPEKPKAEVPKPVEQPQSEIEAARKKADDEWIEKDIAANGLTSEQFDAIIANGDVKAFNIMRATDKLETRRWMAAQFDKAMEKRDKSVQPILEQHSQIAQFQAEHRFLDANPDIKAHDNGANTYREVAAEMNDGYSQIQQKIAQNTASPQERAWSILYETMTPEQFNESVAAHTRNKLAISQAQPVQQQPQEAPTPAPAPEKPQPKPFSSDRPGGVSRQVTESSDARAMREMNERQGITI